MAHEHDDKTVAQTIGIIGAGAAGLVTTQVLMGDGFDVQIITRDKSVGGVWAKERVYPSLNINNVHGEFRFSSLLMLLPFEASKTGGRLFGDDMCAYMENFADTYLQGKIKFQTEDVGGNTENFVRNILKFSRIVLCTGGCSNPKIPDGLSLSDAEKVRFQGLVLHSSQFRSKLDRILELVGPASSYILGDTGTVIIVGGGKSAQDIATYLANEGRKVIIVFDRTDAILAVPTPLPNFIRKSRFLGILSPHIKLRSRLEHFLHGTWLGSMIVHFIWNTITEILLYACGISKDSPLRNAHSLFWGIRTNDEGAYRKAGFHGLVNAGQIELVAPARIEGFADDGRSLKLNDGKTLMASVVILATGYSSSWSDIFDEEMATELGISRHPPLTKVHDIWNYASLSTPPHSHPDSEQWASSIYRGIVPAKNLDQRDFAINGAVFTTNNGYVFEVAAHWISSYFLNDTMGLPPSPEAALAHAEHNSAWLRKRFPDMLLWTNESYSSNLAFWTWPQFVDELLEDMHLPNVRSSGNWLTWPFKVIDLKEIVNLGEERRLKRHGVASPTLAA